VRQAAGQKALVGVVQLPRDHRGAGDGVQAVLAPLEETAAQAMRPCLYRTMCSSPNRPTIAACGQTSIA
jgi:hypothetical protein